MAEVCVSLLTRVQKSTHTPTHAPPTLRAPCQFELRPGGCHRISRCLLMLYLFCVKSRADALSLFHSLSSLYVLISTLFHSHAYASAWTAFYEYALKYHTHTVCHTQEHSFRAPGKRSHNFLPGD
jgi:hypothetical protein